MGIFDIITAEQFLIISAVSSLINMICSFLSPIIADRKNRNPVSWFVLCFVFGLIPFIVLLAIPKQPQKINRFN